MVSYSSAALSASGEIVTVQQRVVRVCLMTRILQNVHTGRVIHRPHHTALFVFHWLRCYFTTVALAVYCCVVPRF